MGASESATRSISVIFGFHATQQSRSVTMLFLDASSSRSAIASSLVTSCLRGDFRAVCFVLVIVFFSAILHRRGRARAVVYRRVSVALTPPVSRRRRDRKARQQLFG